MAIWIILSLAAAAFWALDNILDRYILTNKLKNAYSYDILTNLNDILPAVLILFFVPIRFDPVFSIVAFLTGALVVVSLIYYNKAMMKEEVSRVAAFEWISPIFVAILSFILFKEALLPLDYFGILLIVVGAFIISHKRGKKIIVSKAIWLVVVFAFLSALGDVISDFSLNYLDFWSFFFWASIGSVASSIIMLKFHKIWKDFMADMRAIEKKTFLTILLVSIFYYIAEVSFYAALQLGSAALVVALVATQPMFALIYALILSSYKPEFLKEHTDGFNMSLKLLGIITIVAGVGLTTIF